VIVLGEKQLRKILRSYFEYYQASRTHLSLGKDAASTRAAQPPEAGAVVGIAQVLRLASSLRTACCVVDALELGHPAQRRAWSLSLSPGPTNSRRQNRRSDQTPYSRNHPASEFEKITLFGRSTTPSKWAKQRSGEIKIGQGFGHPSKRAQSLFRVGLYRTALASW
jgi:hypothetical protein